MLLAASVVLAGVGCKGPDRKEVCRVALETFDKDWTKRLETTKDDATKKRMQIALDRMREKFGPYCEAASEQDLDCIQKGANIVKDPQCKEAAEAMKKILVPSMHED